MLITRGDPKTFLFHTIWFYYPIYQYFRLWSIHIYSGMFKAGLSNQKILRFLTAYFTRVLQSIPMVVSDTTIGILYGCPLHILPLSFLCPHTQILSTPGFLYFTDAIATLPTCLTDTENSVPSGSPQLLTAGSCCLNTWFWDGLTLQCKS